jgi:D-arabinose 1-dehydrogenase-like Zn-dependent alcohol dehydrogenase
MTAMQALFYDGNEEVHVAEVPIPEPKDGEVLVRVLHSGVCQAEFAGHYHGDGSPKVQGHEYVGRVEHVGPGVQALRPGEAVMCYTCLPCGTCSVCRAGNTCVCPHRERPGQRGGFAEYAVGPEKRFLRIPEDFLNAHGTLLLDTFGMMYHGMRGMGIGPDSCTGVVGLLSYGFGAVAIARQYGARVIAFDASPCRRGIAEELGAEVTVDSRRDDLMDVVNEFTGGDLLTEVVECNDPEIAFESLFSWARPGGHICIEGHTGREFALNPNWITLKQLTVTGTPLFEPEELPAILDLARACNNKDSIITHRPRLEEAQAALADYARGEAGKVVFDLT